MSNRHVGIILGSSKATVARTVVRDTLKDTNSEYGDGLAAIQKASLVIKDSLVERNARAGVLFSTSGGSVHNSLIRGNVFAIDLEEGASPIIGDNNQMVDNQINHVTIGKGLKVPTLPSVPNLGGPDAGLDSSPDAGMGAL